MTAVALKADPFTRRPGTAAPLVGDVALNGPGVGRVADLADQPQRHAGFSTVYFLNGNFY